jgi:hypothetical protein
MLLLAAITLAALPIDVTPPKRFEKASSPSVAIDDSGRLFVAFGQGSAIYVANSLNSAFSEPVKVAEPKALALGMRRGPRIAVQGSTIVVSAIAGEIGRGKDENLYVWASLDRGASWKGPSKINDAPASAREGLHAMAYGGSLFAATWLDMRDAGTRLYMSTSPDGLTWSENVEVYRSPSGTICECCQPSLAIDPQGRPTLMWRNSLKGARDMFLLRSRNGRTFEAAQKLGVGTWKLQACPMDGGALALDTQGTAYTVWRREGNIYACEPGREERFLGAGQQPWLAVGPKGPVYAWLKEKNGALMLLEPGAKEPKVVAEKANDPVLASGKNQVVLVWTDASGGARIRSLAL